MHSVTRMLNRLQAALLVQSNAATVRTLPAGGLRIAGRAALSLLLACSVSLAWAGASNAPVRFGGHLDVNDARYRFSAELLELALRKGGSNAEVTELQGMTQPRMVEEMRQGRLDVATLPLTFEPPAGVRAVRFPIRRGLLGVRLLLAPPGLAPKLAQVKSIEELKHFKLGYGADWLDRPQFERLGFKVVPGVSYTGLFDMMRAGRFDYMSRGVNEIFGELDHPELGPGLVVVPRVALFYPLDDYFFVGSARPELAGIIQRGLEKARTDGSLARLFDAYFGAALERARMNERVILHVTGYKVPAGTPIEFFDVLQTNTSRGEFKRR
jgi:ABC-type amino acid transport substrate-binding protein